MKKINKSVFRFAPTLPPRAPAQPLSHALESVATAGREAQARLTSHETARGCGFRLEQEGYLFRVHLCRVTHMLTGKCSVTIRLSMVYQLTTHNALHDTFSSHGYACPKLLSY